MRTTRTILAAMLLPILMPTPRVEAQSISLGVMAGGSLSTFTGDLVEDAKQYGSFIGGAFAHVGVGGFAVQPGIFYTTKGAKFENAGDEVGSSALHYLQIPLVLRLGFGSGKTHLYVGAGPAIGIKLSCRITPDGANAVTTDCPSSDEGAPASTEVSGIAEAGLEFGKFSIGARADLGLSNVFKAANTGSLTDVKIRTRTLSAVAAIRF